MLFSSYLSQSLIRFQHQQHEAALRQRNEEFARLTEEAAQSLQSANDAIDSLVAADNARRQEEESRA